MTLSGPHLSWRILSRPNATSPGVTFARGVSLFGYSRSSPEM